MSDNNNHPPIPPSVGGLSPEEIAAAASAPAPITIVLTLDPATGALHFSGPMTNKLLVYGVLELAKEMVAAYDPSKAKNGSIPDSPRIHLPFARR